MIYWKCPDCHHQSFYEGDLIMKNCWRCGKSMELVEEKTLEAIYNGFGD